MKIVIECEADNGEAIIKALKEIKGFSSVIVEGGNVKYLRHELSKNGLKNSFEFWEMEKIKKLWSDIKLLREIEREMHPAGEAATYNGWLIEHPAFRDLEYKLKEKIKETLEEKEK